MSEISRFRQAAHNRRDDKELDLSEDEFEVFCMIQNTIVPLVTKRTAEEIFNRLFNGKGTHKKQGYVDVRIPSDDYNWLIRMAFPGKGKDVPVA